jgi:hypothetical protein
MCVVSNPQTSITHCLCLSFSPSGQQIFGKCIFDHLDELGDPLSLLLLRLDLIVQTLNDDLWTAQHEIRQFALALSTGNYMKFNPEESFQLDLNLNEISRALTITADRCAAVKSDIVKILRTMEDFREMTRANKDSPDPPGGIDLRTAKCYRGEDILGYLILVSRCQAEECRMYCEQVQAHIQTVCDAAVDGSLH